MNALNFARQRLLLTTALVAGAAAITPLGAGLAFAQTETTAGDVTGTNPFAPPADAPSITDVASGVQVDLKVKRSVINWKHFNIVDPGRTINFSDLSGLPAGTVVSVLNRVIGNGIDPIEASVINGLISSSSNVVVWISNPMGITFGSTGVFSGGSLVLTTAAITTSDFRGNDDDASLTGAGSAAITLTAGSTITAADRFVAMGQNISNSAVINANGEVALIAAQDIDLSLAPGSPISFTIKKGTTVGSAKLNTDGTINASSITLTGAGRRTAGSESDLLLEIAGNLRATATDGKIFIGTVTDSGDDEIGGNADRMQLVGDTSLTGQTIQIASNLDSDGTARALTIQGNAGDGTAGNAVLGGLLGATSALKSISVAGTTRFDAAGSALTPSVATTEGQTYTGAVTLGADTTLTAGTGITFGAAVQSAVDGAAGLAVTATTKTVFTGAVGGGGQSLKSLTATGAVDLAGGLVATRDAQTYNNAVVLLADTALTSSNGGAVTFKQTVDSDAGNTRSLAIASTGTATFEGRVGATDKLSTLSVPGPTDFKVAGTLLAPSVQTTGAQTYTGAVTLSANTVLSGTSATFGSTVNGASQLDVLGNAVFRGIVGGTTALTALSVSGATEFDAAGAPGATVTTTGDQTYTGAVTLKQDTVLNGANATFASTIDGAQALSIGANAVFKGAIGAATMLTSLSVGGATEFDVAGAPAPAVTTTGDQTYTGAVTLKRDTVLNGANTTFGSTVNGAQSLNIGGNAVFKGIVGGTTALTALSVGGMTEFDAVGAPAPTVTTTGAQTYTGAVTLKRDTVLSGTTMTFASTVDGARRLNVLGDAVLKGVIGGSTALTALSVSGATEFDIAGAPAPAVTTTGNQTYTGAVTLKRDTVLSGATSTFGSTVNGAQSLNITGGAVFRGIVGGTTALTALSVSGASEFDVVGAPAATVTTTGDQTYTGAVTLKRDTVLTGNAITFGNTVRSDVDGASALAVTAVTKTRFGGAVGGGGKALKSLTITGAAELAGGLIVTRDAQLYNDAVVLGANTTLTSNNGGAVTFKKTIDSDAGNTRSLAIGSTGVTTFEGRVGGTDKLSTLSVTGPTDFKVAGTLLAPSVQTTGAQTYSGAVTLSADTVLDGTSATFGSTVNGAQRLDITGNAVFRGVVGGTTALTALAVGGATELDSAGAPVATITTTGNQTYTGAVTLKQDAVLTGNAITFGSTVQSDVNGGAGLNVTSATKTIFTGAVGGGGKALKALTTTGAVDLLGGLVVTRDAQLYNDAVVLGANTTLTSNNGGAVTFKKTVDSDAGNTRSLAIGSTGVTTFEGRVGGTDKLSTLSVTGPTDFKVAGTLLAPSVQTTGTQTYTGPVTLSANTVLSGTRATFGSTVNGASQLDVLGDAVFRGIVGGTTALTALSVSGSTELDAAGAPGATVTTTGDQTYTGAVTLKQDAVLTGNAITFGSTVQSDVDGGAGLNVTSATKTIFTGAVGGGGMALKALTTTGAVDLLGGLVVTRNAQLYNDAVRLLADTTLTSNNGGAVTFKKTVDSDAGNTRSLAIGSTGTTTFEGRVGGTDKLSTLSVTGPTDFKVVGTLLAPSVQTTGAQTYTGPVTLSANTVLSGTSATFGSTVNGASQLDVLGDAVFRGIVGGTTALTALSVSGSTELDAAGAPGATVTTTGDQTYTGAVTLKQDAVLKAAKATFGSTVKGTQALTVDGNAVFKGVVGGNGTTGEVLTALTVTGTSEFDVAGASVTPLSATVTTTGEQSYGGAATLKQDTVFKGSKISFQSVIDGLTAGAQRLAILGNADFGGNVGAATRLRSVDVLAPTSITAAGSINALERIVLDAGGVIAVNDLTTTDTVAGSGNILINQGTGSGPVTVAGNVSATGNYRVTGTSVTLGDATARTQQALGLVSIKATAGDVTQGAGALLLKAGTNVAVDATGNALLGNTTADASSNAAGNVDVTALGNAALGTGLAGSHVLVKGGNNAALGNATAANDFVKVEAGAVASVTGAILAKTDYTVLGGTGVVLGDALNRLQQAGGKVSVTATTGDVTQGAGLLTLKATGTNVAVNALTGSALLGRTTADAAVNVDVIAARDAELDTGLAGSHVLVKGGDNSTLGTATALTDFVKVEAGKLATVLRDVSAKTDYTVTGSTGVVLGDGTARTQSAGGKVTITAATGDVTQGAGLLTLKTETGGTDVLVTATTGNVALGNSVASAARNVDVKAAQNVTLGTATAALGFVKADAGQKATVLRDVSARTDYTVIGGTGVVLGDAAARTQSAGGKVTITATTGDVTKGAGLLTLQSDSDGTGGDPLSIDAVAGNVILTASALKSGAARQSDVMIKAAGNASLASVDGRNITVSSNTIALNGPVVAAANVRLVNRGDIGAANDTVIGGAAADDGTKFVLSKDEIAGITAPSALQIVTEQRSGVVQNVLVKDFNVKAGGTLFGIFTEGPADTSKITLTGAITGAGYNGTLQIGGNTAAGALSGSIVGEIDTATIDLQTGGLDLRAGRIAFGRSTLLTDAALTSGDVARIARDLVSNAASTLYIQGTGGAKLDTAGNFLRAKSMRVAYSGYALFQNTGTPGNPVGVLLGDPTLSIAQTGPTLMLDASIPAGADDAFALFGTINGFVGRAAGLLPESVVAFSTGSGSGRTVLITQSNSRINGCVIGSPDKGCLVTDVQPPALKLFDERQAQIFSAGNDDSRVLLDPLIATNNEALIGDLAVPTLNYEVPACELNADGECDKGKK